MLRRIRVMLLIGLLAAALPAAAGAQTPLPAAARGRIVVTVFDQTEAVIPNATITVTGQDEATAAGGVRSAVTSRGGTAVVDQLAPGRYTVRAEFPGFQAVTVRDLRVRAGGESRRSLTLPIEKIDESLTVGRDKQTAALDQRGAAFSTFLSREQIDALPDDPDEMEQALKALAPPGSTIRVDGFTGGKLPPKSQIRSIRLPRMDMMAAQNHGGMSGAMHIDILTQPGQGPMRGSLDLGFRDDALNARNPFAPGKGDEGLQRYGVTLSSTIKPNRSSFSFTAQRTAQYDTTNLLAAVPAGTRAEPVRQPSEGFTFMGRFDQMVSRDHALRASVQRVSWARRNQGIGGFDLPERGYRADSSETLLRLSENGPLGRRMFVDSRLQVRWADADNRSVVEAPTIRVLDAFTSGGAQQSGGSRALELEAASDLDYSRGRHSMRAGFLLEGGRYRSSENANYLGTFTFSSMADYLAGRPASYSRRIGDPDVRYSNLQAGAYVQDDFRVSKGVMLSYGLRYEAQSLASDRSNFSPRITATWSPLKSGRTTVRAGWGWFSDWLPGATYRQTLQVDGTRQRELNAIDPSYPEPGAGSPLPSNRYLLASDLGLPQSMAFNLGVEQQFKGELRANVSYTYRRGMDLLRGRNLNSPVAGVRPDPLFGNVIEATSDASSRSQSINASLTMFRFNWRRTLVATMYSFTRNESNTAGAFALPASGDALGDEWALMLPKHRFSATFNMQVWRGLGINVLVRGQSGTPYNITTGRDDNGDGVFTDRPAGVRRNAGLTPGQWDVGARASYAIAFGPKRQGGGGNQVMVQIGGPGGGMPGGSVSSTSSDRRFRLEFYAAAQNLTNHANDIGYSGVLTSPFFGRPTSVLNPRKIELGLRFGF